LIWSNSSSSKSRVLAILPITRATPPPPPPQPPPQPQNDRMEFTRSSSQFTRTNHQTHGGVHSHARNIQAKEGGCLYRLHWKIVPFSRFPFGGGNSASAATHRATGSNMRIRSGSA
jgi:hypothetical protein